MFTSFLYLVTGVFRRVLKSSARSWLARSLCRKRALTRRRSTVDWTTAPTTPTTVESRQCWHHSILPAGRCSRLRFIQTIFPLRTLVFIKHMALIARIVRNIAIPVGTILGVDVVLTRHYLGQPSDFPATLAIPSKSFLCTANV